MVDEETDDIFGGGGGGGQGVGAKHSLTAHSLHLVLVLVFAAEDVAHRQVSSTKLTTTNAVKRYTLIQWTVFEKRKKTKVS